MFLLAKKFKLSKPVVTLLSLVMLVFALAFPVALRSDMIPFWLLGIGALLIFFVGFWYFSNRQNPQQVADEFNSHAHYAVKDIQEQELVEGHGQILKEESKVGEDQISFAEYEVADSPVTAEYVPIVESAQDEPEERLIPQVEVDFVPQEESGESIVPQQEFLESLAPEVAAEETFVSQEVEDESLVPEENAEESLAHEETEESIKPQVEVDENHVPQVDEEECVIAQQEVTDSLAFYAETRENLISHEEAEESLAPYEEEILAPEEIAEESPVLVVAETAERPVLDEVATAVQTHEDDTEDRLGSAEEIFEDNSVSLLNFGFNNTPELEDESGQEINEEVVIEIQRQFTLEELIDNGFEAKEQGRFHLAAEWFLLALDQKPNYDITYYLIIDACEYWKNGSYIHEAYDKLTPYIKDFMQNAPLEWKHQLSEWLRGRNLPIPS